MINKSDRQTWPRPGSAFHAMLKLTIYNRIYWNWVSFGYNYYFNCGTYHGLFYLCVGVYESCDKKSTSPRLPDRVPAWLRTNCLRVGGWTDLEIHPQTGIRVGVPFESRPAPTGSIQGYPDSSLSSTLCLNRHPSPTSNPFTPKFFICKKYG